MARTVPHAEALYSREVTPLSQVPTDQISLLVEEAKSLGRTRVTIEIVEALLQVSFAASLQANEHKPCRFRLGLLPPDEASVLIRLPDPQAFSPSTIRRLAAGAGQGAMICAWIGEQGELHIWGLAQRNSVAHCFVEAVSPGSLKLGTWTAPVLVVEPSGTVYLGHQSTQPSTQIAQLLVAEHPDFQRRMMVATSVRNILRRMVAQSHGGALVVLGRSVDNLEMFSSWGARASEPSRQIAGLMDALRTPPAWQLLSQNMQAIVASQSRNIEEIESTYAELSEMDGALVVDADLCLIGAGAKIASRGEFEMDTLRLSVPPQTGKQSVAQAGGTRHQSAARLVAECRDCLCFVVSADGPVTAFGWLAGDRRVVAIQRFDWIL